MSFLAPLYLALGAAIAVPLLIHLLRRRLDVRVEFPAARYLARAEREHSRTLRLRNLLLMALRILVLLAVAAAAAQPVARWVGSGHGPTAMAIVIDNSMSTGVVVNGRPLIEQLKSLARSVAARATATDRVWLVTVDGEVRGGAPAAVLEEIQRLEPIAGAGDLPQAMARAANLVRGVPLPAKQVVVLTDGQRSAWSQPANAAGVQVLLWVAPGSPPANRAVTLAEARPVRWTPRGAVAARIQSRDSTSYRMTLGGRTFARGSAAPNEEVTVHAAPPERGWVQGTVELEPDELPADNVRHFAVWIGPAPGVVVSPGAGSFLQNAVDVLRASDRVVQGSDIGVVSGDELTTLPALITAPSDPVKIGAANRALERAGVPWRFGPLANGEASVRGDSLDQVSVSRRYQLISQAGAASETLAVIGQQPWIVSGPRFVLVGSPLVPEATSLPVKAAFIPWLAAVINGRLVGEPGQVIAAVPGQPLTRPRWADGMESSDGVRTTIPEPFAAPTSAGTYFFTRGDRRVGALVVNPQPEESNLERFSAAELASRSHITAERVLSDSSQARWQSLAFRAAARRPLLEPALLLALVALGVETLVIGARGRRVA